MVDLKRIWLLRHGSTASSEEGRFLGWGDEPLSYAGRVEARALRGSVAMVAPDQVWSSDLTRAVETARLVVEREPRVDRRLREIDFGDIEGLTWEQLSSAEREMLARFEGFTAPGGESVTRLGDRVHEFVEGLAPGRHLVVTHGGVIRLLLRETGDRRRVEPGQLVELLRGPSTGY